MAIAVQKITLSSSRDILFNKLILSQSNVRKIKAGISVEELAEDIARRGLLQGINVRPVVGEDGAETGMFEIPAGGRRYRALELLVKQRRLAKTAPVPCVVRDRETDILAEDDSLAENVQRVALHPLDQFRAFQALRDKGQSEEEIAAAFFVSVNVVKQRLRLAAVSPALLDLYAEDGISLDLLMAFTVNPDHSRQEQIWDAIRNSWQKEPWQIRRMLTETTVRASDKRAAFVGPQAYEAAGGVILRDLFEADDGGWLQDVGLLDRLVDEKLKVIADEIANAGWKWIDAAVEIPYGHNHGMRRLEGTSAELTEGERATRDALRDELDRLESEYADADELPGEVDERLGEIETALGAFEARPVVYDPDDIARAGVFLSIDRNGALIVDRGYVRPADEVPVVIEGEDCEPESSNADGSDPSSPVLTRATITIGGQSIEPEDEEEDVIKPLPERLMIELTAHRTLALRDAVANMPSVAFLAVLHQFCLDVFSRYSSQGAALEVTVRSVGFQAQEQGLKESPSVQAIEARHRTWEERLPADHADLWDALVALDGTEQAALFAHCASFGVNAIYEKPNPYSGSGVSQAGLDRRLAEADRLAHATGLDMVEIGWKPTVENYLGRVTKPRILEAVREGAGERAAQLIDHLKKGDMAKEAERLLADTGWLPEPLRLFEDVVAAETSVDDGIEAGAEALPDFLAGDDEPAQADEDQSQMGSMIAAE